MELTPDSEATGTSEPPGVLASVSSLKGDYCRHLDGKAWDQWEALFTDDATMQVGPDADSAIRGRSAIRSLLISQLRGSRTEHRAREPMVSELEAGRYRVVWEMEDRVETPLYLLEGAGFYEDQYVTTDEGWRIASVRLHRTKVDLQPRSLVMKAILKLHRGGWLRRLSPSSARTLSEALHVGLAEGERP